VTGTEAEVRAKSGSDALRWKTMGKAGLRVGITKAAKKYERQRISKGVRTKCDEAGSRAKVFCEARKS
jgi:hypothetical protein